MCGIFGVIQKDNSSLDIFQAVNNLLLLSESRGKDASGIATITETDITILKRPYSARNLVRMKEYQELLKEKNLFGVIGHARMETNGSYGKEFNNQPVVKDGIVTIHNGIIVNDTQLWNDNASIKREYEVDTEIINSLLRSNYKNSGDLLSAIRETFSSLEGSYSTISLLSDLNSMLLATNTGSLYELIDEENGCFMCASEEYFLKNMIEIGCVSKKSVITQVRPGDFQLIKLSDLFVQTFSIAKVDPDTKISINCQKPRLLNVLNSGLIYTTPALIKKNTSDYPDAQKIAQDFFDENTEKLNHVKRCTKCLLPETMPFIKFDTNGVCNYCVSYVNMKVLGVDKFMEVCEQYRSKEGKPDCIVPFSGGRDSSYGIHLLKKELKLNPVTFTYDWGMVTDLARRNIARICGKLGIENILISADIQKKRENVRKNVKAWLKRPNLGTVPLFMAGDKHFFYYVNIIKKQTGIKMDVWMGNKLENTDFKVGFCGISPDFDKKRIDDLNSNKQLKLAQFYAREFSLNPKYLNSSLFDTIWAYFSYYREPRIDYYLLYDYVKWDEKTIMKTLFDEYDWELASDTTATWRIGDGTAPIYNYIYFTLAGFSEVDTFRSNQIREGMITREEGLKLIKEENKPRIESIKWYCDVVGLDLMDLIKSINSAQKLY